MARPSRTVLATLALVAAAVPAAASAQAVAPQPFTSTESVPAGALCDVPIDATFTGRSKVVDLPGGRHISTSPGLTGDFTNPLNGKTFHAVITGAWHVSQRPAGGFHVVATGVNQLVQLAAFDGRDDVVVTTGRVEFDVDADLQRTGPLTGAARVTSVCDVIR